MCFLGGEFDDEKKLEFFLGLIQIAFLIGAFFIAKIFVVAEFAVLIAFGSLIVLYIIAAIIYSIYEYYHTL